MSDMLPLHGFMRNLKDAPTLKELEDAERLEAGNEEKLVGPLDVRWMPPGNSGSSGEEGQKSTDSIDGIEN